METLTRKFMGDEGSLDWMGRGACVGRTTSIFFPGSGQIHEAERAREICAECDVKVECLDYALTNHIGFGIWGGTGEKERRRMRRVPASMRTTGGVT